MEAWMWYAISAFFIWSVTNITDKFLIEKKFKNGISYAIAGGLFQAVALLAIPFVGFSVSSWQLAAVGLFTGAVFFLSFIPYFKALSLEDATVVIPLGCLNPVLVLVLSFLFLGESLGMNQILAFIILVIGGFVLSTRGTNIRKIKFTPVLKYLALSMVMAAIAAVLTKYTLSNLPVFESFVLLRTGTFLVCMLVLLDSRIRKALVSSVSNIGKNGTGIFLANQSVGLFAQFLYNVAVSLGSIALISASQGMQYVFLFFIAMILSFFAPNVLKEKTSRNTILRKSLGICLVVIGLYILNMGN